MIPASLEVSSMVDILVDEISDEERVVRGGVVIPVIGS